MSERMSDEELRALARLDSTTRTTARRCAEEALRRGDERDHWKRQTDEAVQYIKALYFAAPVNHPARAAAVRFLESLNEWEGKPTDTEHTLTRADVARALETGAVAAWSHSREGDAASQVEQAAACLGDVLNNVARALRGEE